MGIAFIPSPPLTRNEFWMKYEMSVALNTNLWLLDQWLEGLMSYEDMYDKFKIPEGVEYAT